MNGGARGYDRFAHWPRGPSIALLAGIVLVLLAAVWTAPGSSPPAPRPSASTAAAATPDRDADLQLYDRIAERVRAGENYHAVAIEEQRARHFPVRPGLAVRLPTLAYLTALMGDEAVGVAALLAALAAGAWFFRLADEPGGRSRRPVILVLLLVGMSIGLNPGYLVLHEVWAGLLLALAIGLHRPGRWLGAWLAAGAALAIREHALPFVLLMGAMAAYRRDRRETAAWSVLAALFAIGLWWHLAQVNALLLASDRPSDTWLALRGLRGLTGNVIESSFLHLLPMWLAAPLALLPLVGWAGWRADLGQFGTLLYGGYGLLFMLAGRDNNFYWALVVTPAWFVGFAFLPMALRSLLASAARARP